MRDINICRKTPHKSKSAAHKHIRNMARRRHGVDRGQIYKCKDCDFFHITRNVQK